MRNPMLAEALARALSPGGRERRVVLLGVGSTIRGDDAAGVRIARRLGSLHLPGVWALEGGTAPENLTGKIRELSPSHLIIADSADMGEEPGTILLLNPDEIAGISFGTHALSLGVLAGYLRQEAGCEVTIMGIQPRSLDFGAEVSTEVAGVVDEAVEALAACLGPAPGEGS